MTTLKSTKRTVLVQKMNKLNVSKNSLVYGWVYALQSNEVLRPIFSQGSTWKHSSLIDKSKELTDLLRELNISFSTGNDAARGGKTGYFVKINTKIS